MSHPIVVKWLSGSAVDVDGKVYIFPHGVHKMRKLIYDLLKEHRNGQHNRQT